MRLHSPALEKALRRRVKRAVRGSPELKREFRVAHKVRKQYQLMILLRPIISLGLGGVVWETWDKTGHVDSGLAVLSLWGLAFVFIHAQRLIVSLYGSTDLRALAVLPISETIVFRWELQKFFLGTLWSWFDFLSGYAALALRADFSVIQWLAVLPMAVLTWGAVISLAALSVSHFPRLPYQLASSILIGTMFLLILGRDLVGQAVVALVDSSASSLNLILPTGWPVSVFRGLWPGGGWGALLFLVPTTGLLWSLRNSLLRLASNYYFHELVLPESPDLVPEAQEANPTAEAPTGNRPTRLGPTAIEEIIQTRTFLAEPTWGRLGFLETVFWRWCSSRELTLAEFIFPGGLAFSKPWWSILRNFGLTCLAALAAGLVSATVEHWIFGAGLFVTLCQVLAASLATGRAFQFVHCGGVNIHLYAGYPIGVRELGAFLFKYSLVQAPLVILFSVWCSAMNFYFAGWPPSSGIWIGIKAAGLLIASRFVLLTFSFSAGTNDTSRIRIRSVVFILFAVSFGVMFAGLGAASLLLPDPIHAWSCWAGAWLEAFLFFRIYSWFYQRNYFDLMSLPRQ